MTVLTKVPKNTRAPTYSGLETGLNLSCYFFSGVSSGPEVKCGDCGSSFTDYMDLMEHIQNTHLSENGSRTSAGSTFITTEELVSPKRRLAPELTTNKRAKSDSPDTSDVVFLSTESQSSKQSSPQSAADSNPKVQAHDSRTNSTLNCNTAPLPSSKSKEVRTRIIHKPVSLFPCLVNIQYTDKPLPNPLICSHCSMTFPSDKQIMKHCETNHPYDSMSLETAPLSEELVKFSMDPETRRLEKDVDEMIENLESLISKAKTIPGVQESSSLSEAPFPKCSICGDIFPDTIFLEEHTKHLHQVHHASTRHRTAVKPPHPPRKYRCLIFAAHILIYVLLCYYVAG